MIGPQEQLGKAVAPLGVKVGVAVVAAAVFAVISLVHGSGICYAVAATLLGLTYTAVGGWRRNVGSGTGRNRTRNFRRR